MSEDLDIDLEIEMKKRTILFRLCQLLVINIVIVLVMASLVYIIYGYLFINDLEEFLPNKSDFFNMLCSAVASMLVAFGFAVRFTRRLSPPLSSIATAARAIAEGDLKVRAKESHNGLIELDNMVRDFNLMAQKLEIMSKDMQVWNATIAHELRTPVTILRGNLQAAYDGLISFDKEHTRLLLRQTDSLTSLIDDLRIVSLADTGQIKLYRELTHIDEIFLEIQKYTASEFLDRNMKLKVFCNDVMGFIDVSRTKQAVLAILHNALQYSTGTQVNLCCTKTARGVTISVEDEGPGIPETHRGKLFEPFYRIEETQRLKRNSSGLGLSVVKAIAQAHGGEVLCADSLLGGAAFIIILPSE